MTCLTKNTFFTIAFFFFKISNKNWTFLTSKNSRTLLNLHTLIKFLSLFLSLYNNLSLRFEWVHIDSQFIHLPINFIVILLEISQVSLVISLLHHRRNHCLLVYLYFIIFELSFHAVCFEHCFVLASVHGTKTFLTYYFTDHCINLFVLLKTG